MTTASEPRLRIPVAAPLNHAAIVGAHMIEVVRAGIITLPDEPIAFKVASGVVHKFVLTDGKETKVSRDNILKNWTVSKIFSDLVRALRVALERTVIYLKIREKYIGDFCDKDLKIWLEKFEKQSQGMKFPQLVEFINKFVKLDKNINIYYKSWQNIRNCLEHRNGIVNLKDTNGEKNLEFVFPVVQKYEMHSMEFGVNRVFLPCMTNGQQSTVGLHLIPCVIRYPIGSKIVIPEQEMEKILTSSHVLALDIVSRVYLNCRHESISIFSAE